MPEQPSGERPVALLAVLAAFLVLTIGAVVAGPSLLRDLPEKREPQPGLPEVRRRVQTVRGDLRLTVDLPGDVWTAGERRDVDVSIENVSEQPVVERVSATREVVVRVEDGGGRVVYDSANPDGSGRPDYEPPGLPATEVRLDPRESLDRTFTLSIAAPGTYRLLVAALGVETPPIDIDVAPR